MSSLAYQRVFGSNNGAASGGSASPFAGGAITSPIKAAAGSAAAPTYSFSGNPTTGLWQSAAGLLDFAFNGSAFMRVGAGSNSSICARFVNTNLDNYGAGFEFWCGRFGGYYIGAWSGTGLVASNGVGISSSNSGNNSVGYNTAPAGGIAWQGANNHAGAGLLESTSTLTAALSGASVSVAGAIPAGAVVVGVSTYVQTAIAGATSFSIGDGTTVGAFGATIATALGTSTSNANWTITNAPAYPAGANIVLTANGGNFTAGKVRVDVYYIACTASLS